MSNFRGAVQTLGVVKIGRNALGVITNLTREGNCSLGYNDIELMWDAWQAALAQAVSKNRESLEISKDELENIYFDSYQGNIFIDVQNHPFTTLAKVWQAAKAQVPVGFVLTGHDIKYVSAFMDYEDPQNLDTEVVIQECAKGFDGAGLYAWVAEYPEEGGIKLGEAQEQSHEH